MRVLAVNVIISMHGSRDKDTSSVLGKFFLTAVSIVPVRTYMGLPYSLRVAADVFRLNVIAPMIIITMGTVRWLRSVHVRTDEGREGR